jgi:hypothetical protein
VSTAKFQPEDVDRIAEAKAARDIYVHNAGVANITYIEKSGTFARAAVGERVDLGGQYTGDTWALLLRVLVVLIDSLVDAFTDESEST